MFWPQRTINHKNSRNCVLFETIRLVIHYDTSDKLLDQVSDSTICVTACALTCARTRRPSRCLARC